MMKILINKIYWFAVVIVIMAISTTCFALPKTRNVPGGIVVVPLIQTSVREPKVFLNHERVMVVPYHKKWTAIAGIPLTTKPGKIYLNVITKNGAKKILITIKKMVYPKDFITIKNKRMVTPLKSDMKRIWREQKVINAALREWKHKPFINMRFIWPAKGRISTPFGLHRYYNGVPRKQHSGIDIAASKNTPIKAPAAGKIILAGDYFFMGNAIFIDHGEGLISIYCHLNKIKVKINQKVTRGEVIGTVGQTGRSTGPHLHWGVRLNGTAVNPKLLL